MQIPCQLNYINIAEVPSLLFFSLFPVLFFYPQYSVVVLTLCVSWGIYAGFSTIRQKGLGARNVQALLITVKTVFQGSNRLERLLNLALLPISLLDYFRPHTGTNTETRMTFVLLGGIIWWYTAQHLINKEKLQRLLTWGACLVLVMICIEASLGNPYLKAIGLSRASHFSILAMTLSLSLVGSLSPFGTYTKIKGRIICICTGLLVSTIAATLLDCDTAVLCLILGMLGYGLGSISSSIFWRSLQISFVSITLALPFICNIFLNDHIIHSINNKMPIFSYIHRLYIWKETSQHIFDRPILGFGVEAAAYEALGPAAQERANILFKKAHEDTFKPISVRKHSLHPHNMILQWWLEWGFIGALWWSGVLVAILERIYRLKQASRQRALAFCFANLAIILVSIGFWQTWWWATWLLFLPFLKKESAA